MIHRPSQRKKTGVWLAVGCIGGVGLLAVVVVAVGAGLFFSSGLELFTSQVADDLRDHPVIVEHLGDLERLELDHLTTTAAVGRNDFAFRAVGTKGAGIVRATCVTVDADTEKVVAGTLELDSGEIVDLFPGRTEP